MSPVLARLCAISLCALLVPVAAHGQAWPTKPVRLISPFAAGGGTDAFVSEVTTGGSFTYSSYLGGSGADQAFGVALSGLLLILGGRVLNTRQILLMGAVITLACGYMVWRMRAAYGNALIDALKAGRLEVFTGEGSPFSGLQNDAAAVQVLTSALQDAKPTTRRLSAQILGKMESPVVVDALSKAISDPDAGVRAAAVSAVGGLSNRSSASAILEALDDPEAEVRLAALQALPQFEAAQDHPSTDIDSKLRHLLSDRSPDVRMQAIAALARAGQAQEAWSSLHAALVERDAPLRVAALETFGQIASCLAEHADSTIVTRLLADTLSNVRVAACHALAALHDPQSAQALVTRLYDKEASVRKAAADALRTRGVEVTDLVLNALDSEFVAARDAALEALTPGSIQTSQRLRRYAQKEIDRLQKGGITDQELEKAKNIRLAEFYRQMKTISGKSNVIGTYEVFLGDYHKLFTAADDYAKVTKADVQRVAQQYLIEKHRTVATLIPEAAAPKAPAKE